tara:strand:+ start:1895 stop:2494 length:600 start_codon:yes stop_codon:yes gene_type:complete
MDTEQNMTWVDSILSKYNSQSISSSDILDGFLTGVLLCSKPVAKETWIQDLFKAPPIWESDIEEARFHQILDQRYGTIKSTLEAGDDIKPVFRYEEDPESGEEAIFTLGWCYGFQASLDTWNNMKALPANDDVKNDFINGLVFPVFVVDNDNIPQEVIDSIQEEQGWSDEDLVDGINGYAYDYDQEIIECVRSLNPIKV